MGVLDKLKAIVNPKDKKKKDAAEEERRRRVLEGTSTGDSTADQNNNIATTNAATSGGGKQSKHHNSGRSVGPGAGGSSNVSSAANFAIPDTLKGTNALATAAANATSTSAAAKAVKEDLAKEINREDFEPLAIVGKGTFASVLLVRATGRLADAYRLATASYNKNGGKMTDKSGSGGEKTFWPPNFDGEDAIFAMKIVPKKKLLDLRRVNDVFVERNVLAKSGEANPFVIKLRHTFQSEHKLFFVMDYMAGGDMRALINEFKRRREPMPYSTVKLYATEIALALVNLHKNGILYRDLKPENILLDAEGHCYLADFGLSKDFGIWGHGNGEHHGVGHLNVPGASGHGGHNMRASSFVGSPMYVAPEVLLRKETYSTPVDFWGFGVILYTMLYGAEPFRGLNVKAIFDQILTQNVAFPPAKFPTPPEIIDLIAKLLIKDPAKRLNGANLFAHPFFSNVDINAVKQKKVHVEGFILKPPPFAATPPPAAAAGSSSAQQQQPAASGANLPAIPPNALLDANQPNTHDTGHGDMYTPEHLQSNFRNSQQRLFQDFGWCAIDNLLQQQEAKEEEELASSCAGSHFDDASSDGYDGESFQGSHFGGSSAPPSPQNMDPLGMSGQLSHHFSPQSHSNGGGQHHGHNSHHHHQSSTTTGSQQGNSPQRSAPITSVASPVAPTTSGNVYKDATVPSATSTSHQQGGLTATNDTTTATNNTNTTSTFNIVEEDDDPTDTTATNVTTTTTAAENADTQGIAIMSQGQTKRSVSHLKRATPINASSTTVGGSSSVATTATPHGSHTTIAPPPSAATDAAPSSFSSPTVSNSTNAPSSHEGSRQFDRASFEHVVGAIAATTASTATASSPVIGDDTN